MCRMVRRLSSLKSVYILISGLKLGEKKGKNFLGMLSSKNAVKCIDLYFHRFQMACVFKSV